MGMARKSPQVWNSVTHRHTPRYTHNQEPGCSDLQSICRALREEGAVAVLGEGGGCGSRGSDGSHEMPFMHLTSVDCSIAITDPAKSVHLVEKCCPRPV